MVWADTLGHKFTQGYALWWGGCMPSMVRRDFEQLADHARELSILSEAEGFQPWPALANFGLSFSRFAGIGDSLTAGDLKNISDFHEPSRLQMLMPFFSSLAAEMLATEGNRDVTLTRFDDAVRLTEETYETWAEPEILRMRGCLLLESNGREDEAEADFCNSLDLARTQQAKLWELRTSIALAQLWQTQGKRQDAHDLLAPVYDWFTEGYETADLRDAKALLDALK